MSSSVKRNDVILALVLYKNSGKTFEFFIALHIGGKKVFKKIYFFIKSETTLPLTNKDGIARIFSLKSSLLKIAQYFFCRSLWMSKRCGDFKNVIVFSFQYFLSSIRRFF